MCAALIAVVLIGCSADCEHTSCYPPGTYIEPNDALGATSAEICFESDCTTVDALDGSGDAFLGFDIDTWEEGRTVRLQLTVFDADGKIIDTLAETRQMSSARCACGVLFYDWKNGRLHRLN